MSDDLHTIDVTHRTLELTIVRPPPHRNPRDLATIVAIIVILIAAIPAGIVVGSLGQNATVAVPTPTLAASTYATSATITFTRVSQSVKASPDTLVAATNGAGQIKATELDVNVTQVISDPINAGYNATTQVYAVPAGCGDTQPAFDAAYKGLKYQLDSKSPGGTVVFYGPGFGFDSGSLTCFPAGGTQSSQPFTYTEQIDGSAFHVYYAVVDAQLYQINRMKKVLPAHEILLTTQTCSGIPPMANQSQTSVTITCATSGTAGWDWSADAQNQLAQSLVGLSADAAKTLLTHTPGIIASSVQVALNGGGRLPQDATAITVQVQG